MIGTKIGFYEITKQLGQGGMGAVYLAEHTRIGNRKVVKVLLPEYSQHAQVVRRFENEARAAALLRHRNIITIDDFGLLPNGQWYILMPFLEGSSLDAFLESHGKLPIHQALHILVQIAAALQAAHNAGIIHRDLKPANVFLTQEEDNPRRVMLLDFGIAMVRGFGDGPETQTGAVFGTPVYMAAEQFEDASRADARSDVFALGVIAYQMVTGTLPFGVAAGAILYNKQITTRPARPTEVPYEWAEILLRSLAVRPTDRPASARAFAVALASVTREDPPFEPSGAEILATVARELMTDAPADEETVKNNASADRVSPMLWGPGQRAPGAATPASRLGAARSRPSRPAAEAPAAGTAVLPERPSGSSPAEIKTTLSAMATDRAPVPHTKGPKRGRLLGAVVALLGAAIPGSLLLRGTRATPEEGTKAAPVAAVAAPPPAPSLPVAADPPPLPVVAAVATPAVPSVAVTISTEPTGAALTVDGKPLGNAPQTLHVAGGRDLQVRAELAGRTPVVRAVHVTEPSTVTIRLNRLAAPARKRDHEAAPARPATPRPYDPNDVSGAD